MAVVTLKAKYPTNRDATPKVLSGAHLSKGPLLEGVGTLETVSGNSTGSIYIMGSVPSNLRLSELILKSDDIGTTTTADLGLYRTIEDGGAAVDVDLFGSAISLKDGAVDQVNQLYESTTVGTEDVEKMIWEHLGLSADPNLVYDLAFTLTGDADAAGTISLWWRGVQGTKQP